MIDTQIPNDLGRSTNAPSSTMTELVSGILSDGQTLVRQQVEMLRAEIKDDVRRTANAAAYMGFGAALTALGGFFLLMSLVPLLGWLFPTLPVWACWAIVGFTFLVVGGISLYLGKRAFEKFNPLPVKSFNALQENLSWKTNHQN